MQALALLEIQSIGDFIVQSPFIILSAALLAWGWSPLARWLTQRYLKFDLSPKSAWWIGFAAFGTWCSVSNGLRIAPLPMWLAPCAGLVTTATVAPLVARGVLSRQLGSQVRLTQAAAVALGTFFTPLVLITVVMILTWPFVRR